MKQRTATILIVDDDAGIRTSLARLLHLEGFRTAEAAHGAEALEYLRHHPAPCVILLDLMMPTMDGWELHRHLQQDPALARIPVVVISAHVSLADMARSLRAFAYFEKPIELDQLVETVERVCL